MCYVHTIDLTVAAPTASALSTSCVIIRAKYFVESYAMLKIIFATVNKSRFTKNIT